MPDVEEHACNTTKGTNLPWVEKYRPNGLQELISHEDIISTIRFVQGANVSYLYNMSKHNTPVKDVCQDLHQAG